MSKQADANQVINTLSTEISNLIKELAVARSIISQYENETKEDE